MNIIRAVSMTAVAAILVSCSVEGPVGKTSRSLQELTIEASREDAAIGEGPSTKTMRNEKTRATLWSRGDRISLFYGSGSDGGSMFTSTQEEDTVKITNFRGTIGVITGGADIPVDQTYFWALYPYDPTAECDGKSITFNLPSNQEAVPSTFANNLFPSMGKSQGLIMGFYNICGGFRFSVSKEGVKKATFRGNNGEKLTGRIKASMVDGYPSAELLDGGEEIVLTAPDGKSFEVGKYYYFVMVPTTFESGFTVKVETMTEKAMFEYTDAITVTRSNFKSKTNMDKDIDFISNDTMIPEAIDMGLSVKWASSNLGATAPHEFGDYYAWGEVNPKERYYWDTYKWCEGTYDTLTKYNRESDFGVVDNKSVLDLEDDAAHDALRGSWRMPSSEEWAELMDPLNCEWTWTTQNDVNGYLVTSKRTDNSIFIPAAGCISEVNSQINSRGWYWLNDLPNPNDKDWATYLYNSAVALVGVIRPDQFIDIHGYERDNGYSVRPVLDNVEKVLYCDDHLDLLVDGVRHLSVKTHNGAEPDLSYFSKDESIASVDNAGNITGVGVGSTIIRVSTLNGRGVAYCSITVYPEPGVVDLGLSVKWGSFNIGSYSPEDLGLRFAWGETAPKGEYTWPSYKWCDGSSNSLTKYNSNSSYGIVDYKSTLDDVDDVAFLWSNGRWRMPTAEEVEELCNNCTIDKSISSGIAKYTSNINGNTVIFPLENKWSTSYIWTSELSPNGPPYAKEYDLSSDNYCCFDGDRYVGRNIRAILIE